VASVPPTPRQIVGLHASVFIQFGWKVEPTVILDCIMIPGGIGEVDAERTIPTAHRGRRKCTWMDDMDEEGRILMEGPDQRFTPAGTASEMRSDLNLLLPGGAINLDPTSKNLRLRELEDMETTVITELVYFGIAEVSI